MIYLASVYSLDHKSGSEYDKHIMNKRAEYAMQRLAGFQAEGYFVFCPVVHSHHTSQMFDRLPEYSYFKEFDRHMVTLSSELWVLTMEGWDRSEGITDEINLAQNLNIPVKYIKCDDYKEVPFNATE